jgi:transcription initiation factor TFIIIB Brf1 subunit/transcription initiation factor TFIIB
MTRILKMIKKKGRLSGKNPIGYVAGLIYHFSEIYGFNLTQREISEKCGITEVTLRSRKNEILGLTKKG